jgi:hypothetical protein
MLVKEDGDDLRQIRSLFEDNDPRVLPLYVGQGFTVPQDLFKEGVREYYTRQAAAFGITGVVLALFSALFLSVFIKKLQRMNAMRKNANFAARAQLMRIKGMTYAIAEKLIMIRTLNSIFSLTVNIDTDDKIQKELNDYLSAARIFTAKELETVIDMVIRKRLTFKDIKAIDPRLREQTPAFNKRLSLAIYINNAAQNGYSFAIVLRELIKSRLVGNAGESVEQALQRAMDEVSALTYNDSLRWNYLAKKMVEESQNRILAKLALGQDVTEDLNVLLPTPADRVLA